MNHSSVMKKIGKTNHDIMVEDGRDYLYMNKKYRKL